MVRELVDNALEAGATQITTVRLLAGGVRLIAVEDNGTGIVREELPMALKRHATSKIRNLQELESVGSFGFRGEALAAINAIADCVVASRAVDASGAFALDGQSGELRPVARSVGTTVEVKELFFSTPARRKFLKTDATELAHCLEAVRRPALARPDVGFALWHEGRLVQQWRAYPRSAMRWFNSKPQRGVWPRHPPSSPSCCSSASVCSPNWGGFRRRPSRSPPQLDGQERHHGLAAIGQGHGAQTAGLLQVRVVKQMLRVGNGGKGQAVRLKRGRQLRWRERLYARTHQGNEPFPRTHPVVVGG